MRRHVRKLKAAVPLPLALLLAATASLALGWMILQPPFQGPDEPGHFGYVQRVVEQDKIPWKPGDLCHDCPIGPSSEFGLAWVQSGFASLQSNFSTRNTATRLDEEIWRDADATLPPGAKADGQYNATIRNPPAYYLYESVPYVAFSSAEIWTRAFVMRLANLPFLLTIVAATWAMVGLLVGPRRWLQSLGAGVVAVNAQLVSVSATVNADILLAASYSVALLVMALIVLRGATPWRWAALVALTALTLLTHPRGLAIVIPAAATVLVALWQTGGRQRRRLAVAGGALGTVGVVLVSLEGATRGDLRMPAIREFGSYVWQFYLPRLEFMEETPVPDYDVYDVYVDRFWGTFGSLDVLVPTATDIMAIVTPIALVLLGIAVVVRRRALRPALPALGLLAVAFLSYMLAAHVAAWRELAGGSTDPVLTARYLLPFMTLFGAAFAIAASALPRRVGPPAAAGALVASFALQILVIGSLVMRFYV